MKKCYLREMFKSEEASRHLCQRISELVVLFVRTAQRVSHMIFPWHTAAVLEAAASPKKQLLQLTRSSILITLLASSAAAFFLF